MDDNENINEDIRYITGDCLREFLKEYRLLTGAEQTSKYRRYERKHVKGVSAALFGDWDGHAPVNIKIKISRNTTPEAEQTETYKETTKLSVNTEEYSKKDIDKFIDALSEKAQSNAVRIEFSFGEHTYEMLWKSEWANLCFSHFNVIQETADDYYINELAQKIAFSAFYAQKRARKGNITVPLISVTDLYRHYIRYKLLPHGQKWLNEYQPEPVALKFGELITGLLDTFPS